MKIKKKDNKFKHSINDTKRYLENKIKIYLNLIKNMANIKFSENYRAK